MSKQQNNLIERDKRVLWHPCTQMKDLETQPIVPIAKGDGVWLQDYNGKRYIDAISSWWVNLFGHNNAHINAAIADQLVCLEQVILAGFSHEGVITLSEQLVDITPANLERCFYADNGSSAVEVALKMSYHYWQNSGKKDKKRIINIANAYHGETLGALSVSDVPLYKATYEPWLLDVITAPSPDCANREPGQSWESYSRAQFNKMLTLLERHSDEVCAVIIEPLVQCAGGMRMYHPVYLTLLRQACDRLGVHLIADEIAVGFGRTGTLFACEQARISPDFICLSKGLTGGYLPLSVVLTTDNVYQAFYADYNEQRAFLHSHSYTGNALACSAALATLNLFQTGNALAMIAQLCAQVQEMAQRFYDHPHISDVRQQGTILAFNIVQDNNKTPYPAGERRGRRVAEYALSKGVILRPLGDVVYIMPPYIITPEELDTVLTVAFDAISHATKD